MIEFTDTHSHIQFKDYGLDAKEVWLQAKERGVTRLIVVGCDLDSSRRAVDFALRQEGVYAVVGIHPHEAESFLKDAGQKSDLEQMLDDRQKNKIVGIGEFGLDYYYENSPIKAQLEVLRYHFELVRRYGLPAAFHVRSGPEKDAFNDFWPIFDEFQAFGAIPGVLHSFSANQAVLDQALQRGLYIALNGIMTFTKDAAQLSAAKAIPLSSLLLETDAPFLTPNPFRGKICTPEHVLLTAEFLADLRGESLETLAYQSTKNSVDLFQLV